MPAPSIPTDTPLLEVSDLRVDLRTRNGATRVVDGVSFSMRPGEALGIVGESGCGKSIAMLSLLGLLPPGAAVAGGTARFEGEDILAMTPRALRRIRGGRIGMVFQDPLTSLNPVMRIGTQLAETLIAHRGLSRKAARQEAGDLLALVGIAGATARLDDYPHNLSGGMRQRVMIAMAVACNPSLLIADEPTTALDVTIQRQVVDLINSLREELGMAVIWISHDLSLLSGVVDRIAVLYSGRVVEEGSVADFGARPRHPYTQGLIASIPALSTSAPGMPLYSIPGSPPDPARRGPGCAFSPRCSKVTPLCRTVRPDLLSRETGHAVACLVANGETA
jgi:peptide/nickel transport system ATP-binding protein